VTARWSGPALAVLVAVSAFATPALGAGPPLCDGLPATILGTSEAEELVGTPGPDVIIGLGGNDTIIGHGGDDRLCGNGGDDVLLAGTGADIVIGGLGNDLVEGNAGNDLLYGGGGDDDLRGHGGDDLVLGGAGDDSLRGGSGDDVLLGLGGRDVLFGGSDSDALSGGRDADILAGGGGDDFLLGGGRNDRIRGGRGSDVVVGGLGKNLGAGGLGIDFCSGLFVPNTCEVVDPGLWDWVRSGPAEALAVRLQDLLVAQTGCTSPLDLEWTRVAAASFPDPGRIPLTSAVDDLKTSGAACNRDADSWRTSLRDALLHLEDFNALLTGGSPQPVGLLSTAAEAAPAAADVA